MPQQRVVVAMSGGVDSSLAAALLKEAGYEVIGVTMQIWPSGRQAVESDRFGGCCGLEAVEAAKQVAYRLSIRHYVMNFRDLFNQTVIANFCQEYSLGRTPNPCIRCNQYIKFDALLRKAREMDADYLATGHYARVEGSPHGYRLLKAVDSTKDQSYFLYMLRQEVLRHLLLPVGNLRKTETRKLASGMGLPTATRRESQDICFIPDSDYRPFIRRHIPLQPGDIVDTSGKVLGRHNGLALYTVGQRHGLNIPSNRRLYVIKLDAPTNRLVVGTEEQLLSYKLYANSLSWISGKAPEELGSITAKIRYRAPEAAAELHLIDSIVEVNFHQAQRAVTPGQSIVFYRGEEVLGGGIIK